MKCGYSLSIDGLCFDLFPRRVDDQIIYGHKIVLITASPRFKNMFITALGDDSTPTIQINDIRCHIFQLVMQYLYSGGCHSLKVNTPDDVLELMAAASFFQLDDLLRYTEARCSQLIDIDNIVSTYIHAKVSYQWIHIHSGAWHN